MKELTDLTDELRGRVVGSGDVAFVGGVGDQGQRVLSSNDMSGGGDGDEVEVVSSPLRLMMK